MMRATFLSGRANRPLLFAAAQETNDNVRLAVLCDNVRDAGSIPSELSDFNRFRFWRDHAAGAIQ